MSYQSDKIQCPFEMAIVMEKQGFPFMKHCGKQHRKEYQGVQNKIQTAIRESIASAIVPFAEDDQPPCIDCPAEIFLYCETTEKYCDIYYQWTQNGRVPKPHRCFFRIDELKEDHPHLTKYCTEDTQKRSERRKHKCRRGRERLSSDQLKTLAEAALNAGGD
jgi:hypothetical protein